MHTPLVSIIIPAYNSEQWIAEAVNSCLNQSYKHIEVIVINDGSTDDTLTVVQQIDDKRLKVFSQMNMGACVARNRGFDESAGEYVKFFDADDYMYPDAIEKQLEEALKLPIDVISYGYAYRWDKNIYPPKVHYNEEFQKNLFSNTVGISTSLPLYPRDVLKNIKGFDVRLTYSQDAELTFRCMSFAYKYEYVDVKIYHYQSGRNKNCISYQRKDFSSIMIILNKYKKQFDADTEWRECLCNNAIPSMIYSIGINESLLEECSDVFRKLPFCELWNRFVYKGSRLCGRIFVLLTYIVSGPLSAKTTSRIYLFLNFLKNKITL